MIDRYDVLVVVPPKSEGGKSTWQKVGAAFRNRNNSYSLELVAMPAPIDGRWRLVLMEPNPRPETAVLRRAAANVNEAAHAEPTPGWEDNDRDRPW